MKLPDGMKKNTILPEPLFDPTTKEEGHDRTIAPEQMIADGLVTQARFDEIKETATRLFLRGQEIAAKRGLILVDTKYEFGLDENDALILIDEIHTPDSSRYWQLASYAERIAVGEEPDYFDKEFLRLWFREHCDPYKDPVLPDAPPRTRRRDVEPVHPNVRADHRRKIRSRRAARHPAHGAQSECVDCEEMS